MRATRFPAAFAAVTRVRLPIAPGRAAVCRGFLAARAACVVAASFALISPGVADRAYAAITADDAADVCPPAADPCVVAEVVSIADGVTLDFGVRTVEVAASGTFRLAGTQGGVACGNFRAPVLATIALDGRAGSDGGLLTIEARGTCAPGGAPCFRASDCPAGSCSLVTSGAVLLRAAARADGDVGGTLRIRAAGAVDMEGAVDLRATAGDGDGGALEVTSVASSIRVAGLVTATSGRSGTGGTVDLAAALDVSVEQPLDVSGGEFDGGTVTIDAGRDAVVGASLHASATRLDGAGGETAIFAGRDVHLTAAAVVEADGGRTASFAGDGGVHTFFAGRDLVVDPGVVVRADGARPDAAGGSIEIDAEEDATVRGSISARALGEDGDGGIISIVGCTATLAGGAVVANAGAGGENALTGRRTVTIAAGAQMTADATGANFIEYGDPDSPPRIAGTVVPAAVAELNDALGPCGGVGPTTTTTMHVPTTTTVTTTTLDTTTTTRAVSSTTTVTSTSITSTTVGPGGCGDGVVEGEEQCDGGGETWRVGSACRGDCTLIACGDPDDSGAYTAVDALFILRAGVGAASCATCVCDVDETGTVRAGDALRVLRVAVGLVLELRCPGC
jgi:hypothetical protein